MQFITVQQLLNALNTLSTPQKQYEVVLPDDWIPICANRTTDAAGNNTWSVKFYIDPVSKGMVPVP